MPLTNAQKQAAHRQRQQEARADVEDVLVFEVGCGQAHLVGTGSRSSRHETPAPATDETTRPGRHETPTAAERETPTAAAGETLHLAGHETGPLDETPPLDAVDLFCGWGGASKGLESAGLRVVLAVDYDQTAVHAHRAFLPGITAQVRDVRTVRPSELAGRFVWASPSCRPYSSANTTGPRGTDHPEYYPLALLARQAVAARVLVIENVGGLAFTDEGRAELDRLRAECADLGKSFQLFTPWSFTFGVQQWRRKTFVVIGAPPMTVTEHYRPDCTANMAQAVTTKTALPIEEAARLQGLPDPRTLALPDARSARRRTGEPRTLGDDEARRLIGNAVPPEMARLLALDVLAAFSRHAAPSVSPSTCATVSFPAVAGVSLSPQP